MSMHAVNPRLTRGPGRPPKYPLRTLDIGESVFLAGVTQKKLNKVRKVYAPMKFSCRTVMRDGIESIYVTRIA